MLSGSLVAGACWIALPVGLRLRFGVMEAITTLLLNFVAEALVSWMVTGPLQESQHIYPQSDPIAVSAQLRHLGSTRAHTGIFIAVALAAALWWVLRRSIWGFAVQAVGGGERAAQVSGGIRPGRVLAGTLLVSGALGGLAGGIEVGGVSYALYQNLSPGYGFTAIAVALLARRSPIGVVAAGLLFGALEAGAGGMQRDAGIPSVAVNVAEAVIIASVLVADRLGRSGTRTVARAATA
jgi:simple sugar transport system permease protein